MAAPSKSVRIGKYEVIDTIGRGGMGVVYLAKDPYLDRLVAIKMMNVDVNESSDFLERFYREAKATASLQHANIVTVYELGEHQGRPFLVMQYVEGSSLEALLRAHRPMTLLEKLNIVIEVCQGLSYAHQRGIIHRDIKPANIIVCNDGGVKIVDFGIARLGDNSMTRTGQILGSLYYMAPEQIREQGIDARADIYAAGVVLYQLLTYTLPFEGENAAATLGKIITDEPAPFRQYGVSCPSELEAITLKALSKNRDQRYASAEAFALSLTEVLDQLRQNSIKEYLERADLLRRSQELAQAEECVLKALKLDRQNTTAARLLSVIRVELRAQLSAHRVRQLKQQAEEALGREDYETAIASINQAIELEQTPELEGLRSQIEKGKAEVELVRKAIARAEAAQRSGDLDSAKSAIDTAFSHRPNDSNVKALRRAIERDLEERERQRQVESLLDAARKHMGERKFTSALDLLREAQKLDPSAPQLRVLLERLASEHQEEKRRKELEQFKRDVQDAIDKDDYRLASTKAAEALKKFASDTTLSQLKQLADSQLELAAQREFVKEQTAAAQRLFDSGRTHKALECVELALAKAPGNARLESLRQLVLDRLAKDRDEADKSTCLRQANEAVGIGRYDAAIELLEAASLRFTDSADLETLLRLARDQKARAERKAIIEQATSSAQRLLAERHFQEAIDHLQNVAADVPSEDLEVLLEQIKAQQESLRQEIEAAIDKGRRLLEKGAIEDAREFLKSRPEAYRDSSDFIDLLTKAQTTPILTKERIAPPAPATQMFAPRSQVQNSPTLVGQNTVLYNVERPAPAIEEPATAEPPQKRKSILLPIGAAVLVLAIAIAAWWLWSASKKPASLMVKTQPGAELYVDGKPAGTAGGDGTIPLEQLSPGHHSLRTSLDKFNDGTGDVTLKAGEQETVAVAMVALPPPPPPPSKPVVTGKLVLRTNVDMAEVLVDGKPTGLTEHGGGLELSLEPGKYKVQVRKAGYKDSPEQPIQIAANKSATAKFSLAVSENPATAIPDTYLSIKAPLGAQVKVDNGAWEQAGKNSLLKKVQPGSHQIDAQLEGYAAWSGREAVSAGDNKRVDITLQALPLPSVAFFNPSNDTVDDGQSVKLSWSTRDANNVSISPEIGPVDATGDRSVSPTKSTTYVLTARGPGGETTAKATVAVRLKAPTVSFGADVNTIEQGQSTTLHWKTQNATEVSISGIGALNDLNGSHSVSPGETTTYTLTAKGEGGSVRKDVIVTVSQPAPKKEAAAPGGEAGGDVQGILAARDRYRKAMESMVLDDIKNAGPAYTRKQLDEIKKTYENVAKVQIQDECSGPPQISGNIANWTCDETTTKVINLQPHTEKHHVTFTFTKENGSWRVSSHTGAG